MLFNRFIVTAGAFFFIHQQAQAICLNPLGCEQITQQECISKLSGIRTEAIAKAQLAECYKLPRVNLAVCEKTEGQWTQYMRSNNGKEWNWPDSEWSRKQECQKQFPRMFAASKWVTKSYCVANADQIRRHLDEVELESQKSIKLIEARRRLPTLARLDDRSFVSAVQNLYYPDIPKAELASRLGIDAPADSFGVSVACQQISGSGSMIEWIAREIARRHNAGASSLQDQAVLRTEALARGKEVVLRYVLKTSREAHPNLLRDQVLPKTCQMNVNNPAFRDGLYYTFEYSDASGRQLSKFSVGAAQCQT